ncbi:MAG: peptidase [Paenibacillus sp.]|nr:peptidase [Paenibacillus sp.]
MFERYQTVKLHLFGKTNEEIAFNTDVLVVVQQGIGPGIYDMKSGIIQSGGAVKAYHDLNIELNRKIVFHSTSEEEISSPTSRCLIEQEALLSEAALVTEPASAHSGALKTARKGVGRYTIAMKGKSTHTRADPRNGVSAKEEMARQIQYIHALTDYNKGTTLNVGVAKGGTRSNVVAEQADINVDVRVATQAEGERVDALLRSMQPQLPGSSLQSMEVCPAAHGKKRRNRAIVSAC